MIHFLAENVTNCVTYRILCITMKKSISTVYVYLSYETSYVKMVETY